MRERSGNLRRRWGPRLPYLGVLVFAALVAWTAVTMVGEWQEQARQKQAEAVSRLVQVKAPFRPTDIPGAMAWLYQAIQEYRPGGSPEKVDLYQRIAHGAGGDVPAEFARFGELIAESGTVPPAALTPVPSPVRPPHTLPERERGAASQAQKQQREDVALGRGRPLPLGVAGRGDARGRVGEGADRGEGSLLEPVSSRGGAPLLTSPLLQPPPSQGGGTSLRIQRYLVLAGRWLVVTRRRALDAPTLDPAHNPSDAFLVREAAHLVSLGDRLRAELARRPLARFPAGMPPSVVRLYALSEDGSLLSLPQPVDDPAAQQAAARSEGAKLGTNPQRPTFASNEFYFRPNPSGGAEISPFYPDLGGQGLVATVSAPLREAVPGDRAGSRGVVSLDLAFAVDWQDFARKIPLQVPTAVVRLGPRLDRGVSWSLLRDSLPAGTAKALRTTVGRLAAQEQPAAVTTPYVLHGVTSDGTVTAFNVAQDTWLAVLFPASGPRLPVGLISLSAVVLGLAIFGFERNRRRAEAAFREKQNLLETMQVPLVVVDPNSDEIVYGNAAAADLGLEAGRRFGDQVSERARERYQRMQIAGPEPRRAYGVQLRVPGVSGGVGEETRHAVVRSVAVTAPIEALHADERHRLGVLFLLDAEADLALYTEEARAAEREKLAGLLSHGVDVLTRILARLLERTAGEPPSELAVWLAGYLDARVHTTAWLLNHWGAPPPRTADSTIEAAHVRATAERLASLFALVRNDDALRASLHWNNGALAARSADGNVLATSIDWPEKYSITCPVRGGFGFFLSEALINAMRHGRPGTVPTLTVTMAPARRDILFAVENERRDDNRTARPKLYGGLSILRELARLSGWDLEEAAGETTFRLEWTVPASERGEPGRAD